MPFGLGKALIPIATSGPYVPPPPPPPPPGTGGNVGQPDFLNLAAEWRADKVKTKPVSATLGINPAYKLAVTSMINQIPGSPDLIVPAGYDSPILLTNTNGFAYAVGQCDTNYNDIFVQTHVTGGGFAGFLNFWGGTPALVSATPINKLQGSAFTAYILASNPGNAAYPGPSIGDGNPGGGSGPGVWYLNGTTKFSVHDGGNVFGNAFRGMSYVDPNDGSQARCSCDYFERSDVWLSSVVCDLERPPTGSNPSGPYGPGAIGGGVGQLILFTDSDYLTGPYPSGPLEAAPNTTFDGACANQGPSNGISSSTFGLWVPDLTQPVQTAYTIDPAAFTFFDGLPSSAQVAPSDLQWINTGNKYYYVTHIMLYNGAHTFSQRNQVRTYINNIWGHTDVHVQVLDSTATPYG